MEQAFPRVDQALRADTAIRSTLGLAVIFALTAAWLIWACNYRITRLEVSDSARLEIATAPSPVQASASGRLAVVNLTLGATVHAGDILAQLQNDAEQLSLAEQQTRLTAITPQLMALESELDSQRLGKRSDHQVLSASQNAARAQFEEANAQAALAEQERGRSDQLHRDGIVSEAEWQRARTAAASKRAVAETLRAGLARLEPEADVRDQDRDVRTRQTMADIARLRAEAATAEAEVHRLEFERDRRSIRAPITGRLAECAVLRPGAHISEGTQLGVILPQGQLQVVAEFPPSSALGKIHAGQHATLRLQGFPWAQYGVVHARVSRVADEIRNGKVRVELNVVSRIPSAIPAQHGLPGLLEVEVERLTPAAMILRSAGQMVGAR